MSSAHYPALANRSKRSVVKSGFPCDGIIAKDEIAYVSGGYLYYKVNGESKSYQLDESITGDRQLVSMGAYILVFPDHVYANTKDANDCGTFSMPAETISTENQTITFTNCFADGTAISPDLIMMKNGVYFSRVTQNHYINRVGGKDSAILIGITEDIFNAHDYSAVYDNDYGDVKLFEVVEDSAINFQNPGVPLVKIFVADDFDNFSSTWETIDKYLENGESGERREVKLGFITVDYPLDKEYYVVRHNIYACNYDVSEDISSYGKSRLRYVNKNDKKAVYEEYDADSKSWIERPSYVKVESEGIGLAMKDRPFANISDSTEARNAILEDLKLGYPAEGGSARPIQYVSADEILMEGSLLRQLVLTVYAGASDTLSISLHHLVPKMDFVIESQNRIWGCRYGIDAFGKFVNEIYASALGDFKSWFRFDGTADDSYTASVGSDGKFTGAINFRGQPIFFKENSMYKVYGGYPAAYQIVSDSGTGTQQGSHKSLTILQNILYYLSNDGVYQYDGSSYNKISTALGSDEYFHGVGGGIDGKYYLSVEDDEDADVGRRTLFVYDTAKGMWHKEDDAEVKFFVRHKNDLMFYDAITQSLVSVKGGTVDIDGNAILPESNPVAWFVDTGIMGYEMPDSKYLSKVQFRLQLAFESTVAIFVEYDSDGYYECVGNITGETYRSHTFPIIPRRCDHFRIRIEGEGDCKIFSMTKFISEGGEIA